MDILIGTALFSTVTLAFAGIALWVRRPTSAGLGASGLAASSTFQSGLAIAAVALWTVGLGLIARGLFANGALVGPYSLAALALIALTLVGLTAMHPLRRLAAYDAAARSQVSLVPDPSGPVAAPGQAKATSAPAMRKAA